MYPSKRQWKEWEARKRLLTLPNYNSEHDTIDIIASDGNPYRIYNCYLGALVPLDNKGKWIGPGYCLNIKTDTDYHPMWTFYRQQLMIYEWAIRDVEHLKSFGRRRPPNVM